MRNEWAKIHGPYLRPGRRLTCLEDPRTPKGRGKEQPFLVASYRIKSCSKDSN